MAVAAEEDFAAALADSAEAERYVAMVLFAVALAHLAEAEHFAGTDFVEA